MSEADLLAAQAAEALLLLERLVVAERAAAHADREAHRLAALHVDVRRRPRAPPRGSRPRASRSGTYSTPIAVPDSIVVIASTRCVQSNATSPSWCAYVSAIEQICSIIAGE